MRGVLVTLTVCLFALPANARYSGGTGEPNDPYQIATAADLIALGETPEDYDKHFILTADIDLDPKLPGGRVFDKAVIGTFTGVFDGNGHTISHFTWTPSQGAPNESGLFASLHKPGVIENLHLEHVDVNVPKGNQIGGLVGYNNSGVIRNCSVEGSVASSTGRDIGGLVGKCDDGEVSKSHAHGYVKGREDVGGLIGLASGTSVMDCNTTSDVDADGRCTGGLIGVAEDRSIVSRCHATGNVHTLYKVAGGLVGWSGTKCGIVDSYARGSVSAEVDFTGGLLGYSGSGATIDNCYYDGNSVSANGNYVGGLVGECHSTTRDCSVTGNAAGADYVGGLIGRNLGSISSCWVIAGQVSGGENVSGLAGSNDGGGGKGVIEWCWVSCNIQGNRILGGIAGVNTRGGEIRRCFATGWIAGVKGHKGRVGGLVGDNEEGSIIEDCYAYASVSGLTVLGGLAGRNGGTINNAYATGKVSGDSLVGGLVGRNLGTINNAYAIGDVNGVSDVGCLVGGCISQKVNSSFWDVNICVPNNSCEQYNVGGEGRTTAEMQTPSTFLEAGWDFLGETGNGSEDIWKMWDGYDYPRLTWEPGPDTPLVFVDINDPGFCGQMSQYEVTNAQYCDFLNAALASGDITASGTDVYGAGGSNSGVDYVGQRYYRCDGSGYTGYGATNGGAARVHYNDGMFSVDNGFGNHPVTYVSWYGAMAFCNYYGYSLPTEDQWQAVADYDGTYVYGCGETIDPGIANYRDSAHPDGTVSVGSFGQSGYGMSDMAGNVWEWTGSGSDSFRIFRGGSLGSIDSDCAVSVRGDGIPYANYYDIGFRVCR
ncbi:MAG: SUMF1/EgtB/PvdO family nonheme iron enzyme [Sedimentisphaerales bacterium]|nr:SUMF1/EgtB/PvdO family nonheme iron enzyme [Sedimentisphaerales bacterium]